MYGMTVQRLAEAAGVSVRTLHLYDKIGLLEPMERTEAGYRLYGEKELLRLQQILFYRELEMPLAEIKRILDAPGFDLRAALREHAQALEQRRERLTILLQTIERTVEQLETKVMCEPQTLYNGFSREQAKALHDEAVIKYGKMAVYRSEEALAKLSPEEFAALREQQVMIRDALFALSDKAPNECDVQSQIDKHYKNVRKFWGTHDMFDPQAEQYAGLAQLYVDDPRFVTWDGETHLAFGRFLREAMLEYAMRELGLPPQEI